MLRCPGGCGKTVRPEKKPSMAGPLMILLGGEPVWFCGPWCAADFLIEVCEACEGMGAGGRLQNLARALQGITHN